MSAPTSQSTQPNDGQPQQPPDLTAEQTANLQKLNSQTLGSSFPVVQLGTGEKVPTGTIATFLYNMRKYDNLDAAIAGAKRWEASEQVKSEHGDEEALGKTIQERVQKEKEQRLVGEQMKLALPLLKMVGMFELFKPEEWARGESSGRKIVGEEAIKLGF